LARDGIARPQLVELLPSIAAQRLVAGYALPEEQPFDPVDGWTRSLVNTCARGRDGGGLFFGVGA